MTTNKLVDINNGICEAVQQAKDLFFYGKVFVYPTDTIYGFGGNPFDDNVTSRIMDIKGRETGKNFIFLIDSVETLQSYVEIQNENHLDFLLSIWPNPITVIFNLNEEAAKRLNQETAAFRIPNNRFCLKLLNELKLPLISTSVNKSGREPLFDHNSIEAEFIELIDALFYSEKKQEMIASTIVKLTDSSPEVLREGKFSSAEILRRFEQIK